ncbi:uncharacterized protein LOC130689796 [Daphnia carinata]|uniref:uncharacterized protein LOC130689796 n=1 Tax=Daphnia carinata TaxID=120202 RepID=UPI00257EBC93|nr:uncharacterized protein LOC130689796 [Daphnia carinata]
MDKILLILMLSIVVCNGRPPRHNQAEHITTTVNRRSTSVLRAIALYANPFGWIGTPSWPRRTTKANRKTKTNVSYLWVIEIDHSNHWWFTVYEKGSQIPGPDKKAIMKLF